MFRRIGRRGMPLVLHPDVWRERKIVFPTGVEMHLPPPSYNDLDREGVEITLERGPSLLLDGTVLITGQVERVTDFEPGFPLQQARTAQGAWEPDVWVWDDQAVVCHVKGKGLLVLTSCSHSGVINVLLHARHITGIEQVYGLVGGMHLTGGLMEPLIPRTLAELATIAPSVVVPGHLHRLEGDPRAGAPAARRLHPEQRRHAATLRMSGGPAAPQALGCPAPSTVTSVSWSDAVAPHARCPDSAHCARQAAASKGSAKYCVSSTTWSSRNSMMLTVSYGFPS
ncbi:MAG: hypothetical protein ACLQUY_28040 [Ktedonobacterales bacterium]